MADNEAKIKEIENEIAMTQARSPSLSPSFAHAAHCCAVGGPQRKTGWCNWERRKTRPLKAISPCSSPSLRSSDASNSRHPPRVVAKVVASTSPRSAFRFL